MKFESSVAEHTKVHQEMQGIRQEMLADNQKHKSYDAQLEAQIKSLHEQLEAEKQAKAESEKTLKAQMAQVR